MCEISCIENETIDGAYGSSSGILVFKNCILNGYRIDGFHDGKTYVFHECKIREMKIVDLHSKRPGSIIFHRCQVYKLSVEESFIKGLLFSGCNIDKSSFVNSKLPGLSFSNRLNVDEISPGIKNRLSELAVTKSMICEVADSTFLFCQLNQMKVAYTQFRKTDLKHCNLEEMEVGANVILTNVNLKGSKFFRPKWGDSKFEKISFSKGILWKDFIEVFLKLFARIPLLGRLILVFLPERKKYLQAKASKEAVDNALTKHFFDLKSPIKKRLYKNRFLKCLIDHCRPTILRETVYTDADLDKANSFYWYVEDMERINRLKEKSLLLGFISYLFFGYLRSLRVLILRVALFISIFAIFYCTSANFEPGFSPFLDYQSMPISFLNKILYGFDISIRVYLNAEISAIKGGNFWTEFVILFEKFYGFISLGAFLAILVYYFSRPTSRSNKRKSPGKDNPDDTSTLK